MDDVITLGSYPTSLVKNKELINKLKSLPTDNNVVSFNNKRYYRYKDSFYLFEEVKWGLFKEDKSDLYYISLNIIDASIFDEEMIDKDLLAISYQISYIEKEDLNNENVPLVTKVNDFAYKDVTSPIKRMDVEDYWTNTEAKYPGRIFTSESYDFQNKIHGVRPVIIIKNTELKEYGPSYIDNHKISKPVVEKEYIYFGEYPSTLIEEEKIISELEKLKPDQNGYLYFNKAWYYSLNNKYTKFNTLYFKVTPIKWKILSKENGYLLTSNFLIDSRIYKPIYYSKDIEIIDWLNKVFLPRAFLNETSLIESISLLSLDDINLDEYRDDLPHYFEDTYSLIADPTDYARIQSGNINYLYYWLISRPEEGYPLEVYVVDENGEVAQLVEYDNNYVRPLIKIKKEK